MITDPMPLKGKRILVIEDDYYQSRCEVQSIELAGGTVAACTGDANEACVLIDIGSIDYALVDINLGKGPLFDTAHALRSRGIPFIFTTGYDTESIPLELQDVMLILKPFEGHQLLSALEILTQEKFASGTFSGLANEDEHY